MTYHFYIFTSYAAVCGYLFILWLKPWQKWRAFLKKQYTYE